MTSWDSNIITASDDKQVAVTNGLRFTSDLRLIDKTGSRDYSVKGWDIETGRAMAEWKAPRNIVTCMTCGTDPNMLYQGSEDLCIRIWDIRTSNAQPAL
eukprot:gene37323-46054_t